MAKLSDVEITSLLFKHQASDVAAPAAGFRRLYAKATGLFVRDSAGAVVGPLGTGGGGGGVGGGAVVQTLNPATFASGGVLTLGAAPMAGNRLILIVATNQFPITTVTQTNVTWSRVRQSAMVAGNFAVLEVWMGVVAASPGSGITVTCGGNNQQAGMVIEYSGLTTVDALVGRAHGTANHMADIALPWTTPGGRALVAFFTRRTNNEISIQPSGLYTARGGTPFNGAGGWLSVVDADASVASLTSVTWAPATISINSPTSDSWGALAIHLVP